MLVSHETALLTEIHLRFLTFDAIVEFRRLGSCTRIELLDSLNRPWSCILFLVRSTYYFDAMEVVNSTVEHVEMPFTMRRSLALSNDANEVFWLRKTVGTGAVQLHFSPCQRNFLRRRRLIHRLSRTSKSVTTEVQGFWSKGWYFAVQRPLLPKSRIEIMVTGSFSCI